MALPSSDTLLSNSLTQNVHTDTASWRRKYTHVRHIHPCPLQAPTLALACGEGPAPLSCMGANGWAPRLARKGGGQKQGACTPTPLGPQTGSREDRGQGNETPDCSKDKERFPTFQTSRVHIKRDGNWLTPREAIKQYKETINTSCQFTYSFFFFTFSLILLAYRFCQYVSHIYYIYLYVSTSLSLRDPIGLRSHSRTESW